MGPREAYRSRLAEVIGVAYEQQLALEAHIGARDWTVDLVAGTITFGGELTHHIELLGSESHLSNTWLWAWANDALELPEPLVRTARELTQLGWDEHIGFLTERTFGLEHAEGLELALLAAGRSDRITNVYRGPYEGGAAFLLLTDGPTIGEPRPERTARVLTELLQFDLDHRTMVEGYLVRRGFELESTSATLEATHPRSRIQVAFDGGRVSDVRATLRPDASNAPASGA